MALVIITDSFHNLAKANLAKRRTAWRSEGQFGEGQLGNAKASLAKANMAKRRPAWRRCLPSSLHRSLTRKQRAIRAAATSSAICRRYTSFLSFPFLQLIRWVAQHPLMFDPTWHLFIYFLFFISLFILSGATFFFRCPQVDTPSRKQ